MDDSFDFAKAPPPPVMRPLLQWDHDDWRKMTGGTHVLTREVREELLECQGFWPTFEAPEVLDQAQFNKFCFYAESRTSDQREKLPKSYVPMHYVHDPDAWYERERKRKAHVRNLRASRKLNPLKERMLNVCDDSSSEEDDEIEEETKKVPNKTFHRFAAPKITRGYCPPLDSRIEEHEKHSLVTMGDDIRGCIADFLSAQTWLGELRMVDKSCLTWPKPPPKHDYSVIIFVASDRNDAGWIGAARTVDDMVEAAKYAFGEVNENDPELHLDFYFLDFDEDGKRVIPIASCSLYECVHSGEDLLEAPHGLARDFLNVKSVFGNSAIDSALYSTGVWMSEEWSQRHGNPEYAVGSNLGHLKAWIGDAEFEPKSSDFDLTHLEARPWRDDDEGQDMVDIWYNPLRQKEPTYLASSEQGGPSEKKSWVFFDETIVIWDAY